MYGFAWLERKLLYPSHLVVAPPARHIPHLERNWLPTEQGRVESWFVPGLDVTPHRPGPLLVFAHGNGELIDHWPELLSPYRALGMNVLLLEYRGYGRSTGTPSQAAIVADLCKALDRIAGDARVDLSRLAYHGRSLGGGVVCALSAERVPKALILESTFTSVVDVARGMGFPRFLVQDRFESLPIVERFTGPVLVLHGTQDRLVPVQHGKRLARANPRAKLVLYDVGHNDLPPTPSDYWQHIAALLQTAFAS